jgi:hypothetical protein
MKRKREVSLNLSDTLFFWLITEYNDILTLILNNLSPYDIQNLYLVFSKEYFNGNGKDKLFDNLEKYLNKFGHVLYYQSNIMIHNRIKHIVDEATPELFDTNYLKCEIDSYTNLSLLKAISKYGLRICEYCKNISDRRITEKIFNCNSDQLDVITVCSKCDIPKNQPLWVPPSEMKRMAKTKICAHEYAKVYGIRCIKQDKKEWLYFRKDVIEHVQREETEKKNNLLLLNLSYDDTEHTRKKRKIK